MFDAHLLCVEKGFTLSKMRMKFDSLKFMKINIVIKSRSCSQKSNITYSYRVFNSVATLQKHNFQQKSVFAELLLKQTALTLSLIRQFCNRRLLNIFCQKMENLYKWMDNLWLKVENIVVKGEIARFEQFLLLSLCFQKPICCRGLRKRLHEGKG